MNRNPQPDSPAPAEDRCQTILLELRPLTTGWRTPAELRLRAALKRLLRDYGLRCETIRRKHQDTQEGQ